MSSRFFVILDDFFFHMRVKFSFSQHFYFIFIRSIRPFRIDRRGNVRGLKYFGYIFKIRMVNNVVERIETDLPETYVFMAVFCRSGNILAVIDVEYGNLVFPDDVVEILYDMIKIPDDIIAAVAGVAGVKAYSQPAVILNAVIDSGQFFERTSDLRTFAGHSLKSYDTVGICGQHLVESFDDLLCSDFCTCAYM